MFESVWTPTSLLTWMYQYPGEFVSWLNQVISIKENGISIFATVLLVALILFGVFNWSVNNK